MGSGCTMQLHAWRQPPRQSPISCKSQRSVSLSRRKHPPWYVAGWALGSLRSPCAASCAAQSTAVQSPATDTPRSPGWQTGLVSPPPAAATVVTAARATTAAKSSRARQPRWGMRPPGAGAGLREEVGRMPRRCPLRLRLGVIQLHEGYRRPRVGRRRRTARGRLAGALNAAGAQVDGR